MSRRIVGNRKQPTPSVNTGNPKITGQVLIDFTHYPNWHRSVELNPFTNMYKDQKHVSNVLANILFSLFPYVQENIQNIMGHRSHDHCHIIDRDHYDLAKQLVERVNHIELYEDADIWYLGVKQGVRLLAEIISDENSNYLLYPLAIDCNHLIYPSKNHNAKDYKKYKLQIKI